MSGDPGGTSAASKPAPSLWAWPLAAGLTAIGIALHLRAPERYVSLFLWLYLPSIVLAGVGCLPIRRARRPQRPPGVLPRAALVALTIGILGVATLARVWGLGTWPPPNGTSFEEAQLGQEASRLLHEGAVPNEHMLAIASPALSFALAGASLTTLRAPFVIAALLTPFALFAVARRLLARELALLAVALYGVSWWSVAAGRIADELFFPVVLTPLALLWLADFADTARASSAFLLALSSGVLIYEYTGYHIVPVLVLLHGLAAAVVASVRWLARREGESAADALRRTARRWAPGLFVVALVWTDLGMRQLVGDTIEGRRYFIEGFARHEGAGCGLRAIARTDGPAYVAARAAAVWENAFARDGGGGVPKIGFGGHPLFDPGAAVILLGGLALVAVTPWRRLHLLLTAWIAGTVAVATLFPCEVNPHRYFTVLPILFLAAALGWQVVWERLQGRARLALLGLLGLAALVSAVSNLGHLRRAFFTGSEPWTVFDEPSTRLSLWMAAREPESLTWVVSDLFEHLGQPNDYHWLLNGRRAATAASLPDAIPSPDRPAGPLYYLVIGKAAQPGIGDVLRSRYPEVERLDTGAIAVPGMDVQAFRIGRAADAKPLDGFRASYWSSRSAVPGTGGTLPADARLLFERREPMLSSLSIPLALKKRSVDESPRGTYLWCRWRGELAVDESVADSFRLYARGGDAWVRINDGAPVDVSAPQGQEVSRAFGAALARGGNTVTLLYRFGPWEMVGAQLYRVAPDGSERVVTASAHDATPLGDPIAPPDTRRSDVTMAGRLYRGAFELPPSTELRFALPAGARALEGMVGLNDALRGCAEASVRFEIRAPDGRRLFDSGRVSVERPQAALHADVTGLPEVALAVTDAEDGTSCDAGVVGALTAYERVVAP